MPARRRDDYAKPYPRCKLDPLPEQGIVAGKQNSRHWEDDDALSDVVRTRGRAELLPHSRSSASMLGRMALSA